MQEAPGSLAASVKACVLSVRITPLPDSPSKASALGNMLRNHHTTSVGKKSVSSSNSVTVSPLIKQMQKSGLA